MRFTLKLIRGILNVLNKLLKYFNTTVILTFLTSAGIFLVILAINLNDSESVILWLRIYLRYCHKVPNVFVWLLSHSITLYITITPSQFFCIVYFGIIISLMLSKNGTQILKFMCLHSLPLHLFLLPWLISFPSQVCTNHCSHKDLSSAS